MNELIKYRRAQDILSSIRLGSSMSCLILEPNLATVAPSRIRWSAEMLKLIES